MNIFLYLLLFAFLGLMTGMMAHWLLGQPMWPWFFTNLLAGFWGAILAGYFVTKALFGMGTVLSAYSLLFALLGALLAAGLVALAHRFMG